MQINFLKPEFFDELDRKDYRHTYRILNGTVLEEDCSLGSAELVRKLMELTEGIAYGSDIREIAADSQLGILDGYITAEDMKKRPMLCFYWDRKTVTIALLQNRNYSMDDRILALGIVYDKCQQFEMAGTPEKMYSYVDFMLENLESCDPAVLFKKVKGNQHFRRFNSIMFFDMLIGGTEEQDAFKAKVFKTMNVKASQSPEANGMISREYGFEPKKYTTGENRLKRFLKGREYILENLVVQWSSLIDLRYGKGKRGIWQTYMFLVCMYLVTVFMTAGNLDKDLKEEDFIEGIAKGCGWILENENAFDILVDQMIKQNCITMAHMTLLLKG